MMSAISNLPTNYNLPIRVHIDPDLSQAIEGVKPQDSRSYLQGQTMLDEGRRIIHSSS